ncbi:MAG: hypothetical protein AAFV29_25575, partial [Myxococcota bacterium]
VLTGGAWVGVYLRASLFPWPPSTPSDAQDSNVLPAVESSTTGVLEGGLERRPADSPQASIVRPQRQAPSMNAVALTSFLQTAKAKGLSVAQSRGTWVIEDGKGGTATIDRDAAIATVRTPQAEGWVIETASNTLPAIAWVGRVNGSALLSRSLSVNDCRASLRVDANGISLRYGRDEVRLPHGGGLLIDVALTRPAFAARLEVESLGLSFGDDNATGAYSHCRTGWWGKRVVLRRLPPGRYALKWIGEAMTQTATMELSADRAIGAQLIRSTQIP